MVVLTFLTLASCKEKLIEPPEDLISVSKMTEILYDLSLMRGISQTNNAILKRHDIKTMPYLYEKYEIDSVQFVLSDEYYASVPEIYQSMYKTVEERLNKHIEKIDDARKQKNDSARARNAKVRDSVRKKKAETNPPVPSKK